MCDKLVYDLAQEVEGSPSVFVRKDWINILDNQNQNYNSNQSVLDTSQLSNSNKYMSYRESYFSVPFLVTIATTANPILTNATAPTTSFDPTVANNMSQDTCVGLKNWYGNIIHSFTVDYNGSTIIQQTPFVNMWNSFKLITSLSYNDLLTQGSVIGFWPDDSESFEFYDPTIGSSGTIGTSILQTAPIAYAGAAVTNGNLFNSATAISGTGTCNNTNYMSVPIPARELQNFKSGRGNFGYQERLKWLTFDPSGIAGLTQPTDGSGSAPAFKTSSALKYSGLLSSGADALKQLWKGYIQTKQAQVSGGVSGILQYSLVATIYLKHIHSFFNMIPLLKGVFMKMTMNLNNTSCTIYASASVLPTNSGVNPVTTRIVQCAGVSSALGGSNMLMVTSPQGFNGGINLVCPWSASAPYGGITVTTGATAASVTQAYRVNLSVGSVCLDSTLANLSGVVAGNLSKSIYLYIPAYTFNPTFEQAYLSSPVKQIKYSDIYQYQVLNVASTGQFNNLLTNGINNVKSVLILPFYSSSAGTGIPVSATTAIDATSLTTLNSNTGFLTGLPVWQSPFDCAGCGTTSPLCHITNFNVQVSGQNAIYNLEKYGFEQFNNQLYGQNAVNGGLTDGITSGLIDRIDFDLKYCYYYVNIERMLPVEQSVPKSIQILGTNLSSKAVDLLCFVEYGTEISIDTITGARV